MTGQMTPEQTKTVLLMNHILSEATDARLRYKRFNFGRRISKTAYELCQCTTLWSAIGNFLCNSSVRLLNVPHGPSFRPSNFWSSTQTAIKSEETKKESEYVIVYWSAQAGSYCRILKQTAHHTIVWG